MKYRFLAGPGEAIVVLLLVMFLIAVGRLNELVILLTQYVPFLASRCQEQYSLFYKIYFLSIVFLQR
jgi:hypothetical protein